MIIGRRKIILWCRNLRWPTWLNQSDRSVSLLSAKFFEVLASSLRQENVLLPQSPVLHNRTVPIHLVIVMMIMMIMMIMIGLMMFVMMRDLLLQWAFQVVKNPLAVVERELLVPREDLDRCQHPVDWVEVLEAHPATENLRRRTKVVSNGHG